MNTATNNWDGRLAPLSCKKDDPAPVALASTPEAEAANDSKSGGVYKGALIGSSGTIKIVLQKGVKEMEIILDGVKKTLTTTGLASWTSGDEISAVEFTSGDWKAVLSINTNGTTISLGFDIPGHAALTGVIGKETSTALIKAFEGKYSGTESGTWNFVVQGVNLVGVSRSTDGLNNLTFYGGLVNNVITIPSPVASGTLVPGNPDKVSGIWQGGSADNHGTWEGTRTM